MYFFFCILSRLMSPKFVLTNVCKVKIQGTQKTRRIPRARVSCVLGHFIPRAVGTFCNLGNLSKMKIYLLRELLHGEHANFECQTHTKTYYKRRLRVVSVQPVPVSLLGNCHDMFLNVHIQGFILVRQAL